MAKRRRNRSKAEMNVVPYIDVMLVLLVIFMISAPLMNQSVEVDLPASDNAVEVTAPEEEEGAEPIPPMVITIDKDGAYYHSYAEDGATPVDLETLTELTMATLAKTPKVEVYLRADKSVNYGSVMTTMDVLKNAGVDNVGFMTDEADE